MNGFGQVVSLDVRLAFETVATGASASLQVDAVSDFDTSGPDVLTTPLWGDEGRDSEGRPVELGLIAGTGMLIILFLTLTMFPALLSSWLEIPAGETPHASLRFRSDAPPLIVQHASAIRWTSSRFLTAEPRLLAASISSLARRSDMVASERSRAALISQRIPSAWARSVRTSTGTW